jgi:hypothetical protein
VDLASSLPAELIERLLLGDREFEELIRELARSLPRRRFEPGDYERALAYPFARPHGSFLLGPAGVEPLGEMPRERRERTIARLSAPGEGREPLLAFGSNGAPEVLARKFAHFHAEDDRTVLVLSGRLHDFDVGASPQPAIYGSMPATLFPSPGTEARGAVLWATPAQLAQLAWSELSYRLGRLRTPFETDEGSHGFDELLAFVSRFGAFRHDGGVVALEAIPATGRTAPALSQARLLDAAAALVLGPGAGGESLVRAVFEDLPAALPKIEASLRRQAAPFASERWTPYGAA